jgi:four helix bundle protein
MRDDKANLTVKKTFDFALEAIEYSLKLRSLHKYEMASQLLGSGTSIGANVWEAQNAECLADFIHKFKIA